MALASEVVLAETTTVLQVSMAFREHDERKLWVMCLEPRPTIVPVFREVNSNLPAYSSAGTNDQSYFLAVACHVAVIM